MVEFHFAFPPVLLNRFIFKREIGIAPVKIYEEHHFSIIWAFVLRRGKTDTFDIYFGDVIDKYIKYYPTYQNREVFKKISEELSSPQIWKEIIEIQNKVDKAIMLVKQHEKVKQGMNPCAKMRLDIN